MSLEPACTRTPIFSPAGSGRTTPSPRAARHEIEGALNKNDKGFRRYAANVERTLALWDTAQQEWADYIAFIQRLLKALQTHPSETPVIPHSETVALRLSQCLNPTLPSGVHQKALEVYDYIFSAIGTDALARDLSLYFPGLAPVLSFASLKVRPLFLSLFEDHVLKLDAAALRPSLKAVILCLLPGIEDETSEDFERVISALDKLRDALRTDSDEISEAKTESGSSLFWQCFFLATITNASRRQGALAYLVRRLPKFGVSRGPAPADTNIQAALSASAEAAITPEPGLLIRSFEAGLSDAQLLTQRGFLDLLVTHLPLDSPVLQVRVGKDDLKRLVAAAIRVVLRRDMSLNRRLWVWLLGPEPEASIEDSRSPISPAQERSTGADTTTYHTAYFSSYGFASLTSSVMDMINQSSSLPAVRARPFRICLSLMDRAEVGGYIVPEVFIPALRSILLYSEVASKDQIDEVVRSASLFFDGVESGLIWGKMIHLVVSALDSDGLEVHESLQRLKLAKFILARFNLREEEMLIHHMPMMLLATLAILNKAFDDPSASTSLSPEVVNLASEIADTLIQIVPERALRTNETDNAESLTQDIQRERVFLKLRSFYENDQGNLDFAEAPFRADEIGQYILRESAQMFKSSFQSVAHHATPDMPSRILSALLMKVRRWQCLDADLLLLFRDVLASCKANHKLPFQQLLAITSVVSALQTANPSHPYLEPLVLREIVQLLVASLWRHLDPLMPKYHVESVRCILALHTICPSDRFVEAAITTILISQTPTIEAPGSTSDAANGRRFAIFWMHATNELNAYTEKRGSISRRTSAIALPSLAASPGAFESVITRPLLILLDALDEEGTELAAFVRSWLQDLVSLNKVFEILLARLQSLHCLNYNGTLSPDQASKPQMQRRSVDDTKECLYFLRHIHHIIAVPSQPLWEVLASMPAPLKNEAPTRGVYMQQYIAHLCMKALYIDHGKTDFQKPALHQLRQTAVAIIAQIYRGPYSASLRDLELEVPLMEKMRKAEPMLQTALLHATLLALKLRTVPRKEETKEEAGRFSQQNQSQPQLMSPSSDRFSLEEDVIHPPPQLIDCLKHGFSSPSSRVVLFDWVRFLTEVVPLFTTTIFQNLLPLVECICTQINDTFSRLKATFATSDRSQEFCPETTLIHLIDALEQLLASAHDRLRAQERKVSANKTPEQPQGLFTNLVSGVFNSENQTRAPTANTRLTVILCFQDAVRLCFSIWSWGGYSSKDMLQDPTAAASFGYLSHRMRHRARRFLENLFANESLECLETLVVSWKDCGRDGVEGNAVMSLLNVINGARPKHTVPAIFHAIYSRTDPSTLEPKGLSTLTSDLAETDLAGFLVEYTKTVEDDAMDEIWRDCGNFLSDVLANPLSQRQILPHLLEFTAVIGQKIDNTNFGDQKKLRKELAGIFTRILTAIFTTRSMGFLQEPSQAAALEKSSTTTNSGYAQQRAADVVSVLTSITPHLSTILVDHDRVTSVVTSISTNVIGPMIRAKAFPDNISASVLTLMYHLAHVAQSNKVWKKDVNDAFNDPRFFNTSPKLLQHSWLPLLAWWAQNDKERLPELLGRLTAPTTAGIMFGVGASSARQEADRRTQLTLRRVALLILASAEDAFTPHIPLITEKIVELLAATPASSPSSVTRAEVMILLRAIIVKTSATHLAPLWPVILSELTEGLEAMLPDSPKEEAYDSKAVIQTCKLLDQLVALDPDDFQLSEWPFLVDTVDAVYKPVGTTAQRSLADEIAEVLANVSSSSASHSHSHSLTKNDGVRGKRALLLDPLIETLEREEGAEVGKMKRREVLDRLARPFLGGLGIAKFEGMYKGGASSEEGAVDWEGVWASVVADVGRV